MQNTWLDDVFFPAIYYRLQCLDFPMVRGFDEFKNRVLLRKIENLWCVEHHAYAIETCYAICFYDGNSLHHFSIKSDESMTEKYISFYANAKKKPYAKFAYEFSRSEIQLNVCYLHKLALPNDAIEQIKSTVINRNNDEYLSFCSNAILYPKETFEEVLIEKDLNNGEEI